MTRIRQAVLFPSLVLALLAGFVVACSDDDAATSEDLEDDQPAPDVEVWTIDTMTIDDRRRWSGRLQPLRTSSVQAPQRGIISFVEVEKGDEVDADEVIAGQHDPDRGEAAEALQRRREVLRDEYERWEELANAGAAGPSESAQAELRLLEVEEKLAELDIEAGLRRIHAPSSGVVSEVFVYPGAAVTQGQELFHVEDAEQMGLRLEIPARETALLEDVDALEVLDDDANRYDIETIRYSDHEHRSFVIAELLLDDVDESRRRHVDVRYSGDEEVLIVPWTAVFSDDDRHTVAVVSGTPPTIERRNIELGEAHSMGIEVVDGLQEGDVVVRYEPRTHREGRPVAPQMAEP